MAQTRAVRPDADEVRVVTLARSTRSAPRRARTPRWTVISPSLPQSEANTALDAQRMPRTGYRLRHSRVPRAAVTPPPLIAILFRSSVQERHVQKDPIAHSLVAAYPGLRSQLKRRLRNEAVVDDMLNSASVVAIDHYRAGRLSDPTRIGGYVYRVAMNLYRNYVRELDNRTDLRAGEGDMQEIPCEQSAQDECLGGRFSQQILEIIEELPTPRDRAIIVRFYLQEESKESICKSLGISPSHFDRVAFRTRQRLRVLLEREGITKEVL